MAIDFRSYRDPGVYIEEINPPVVFNPAVEPTILAIVGDAAGERLVVESPTLSQGLTATPLAALGGDPTTLILTDILSPGVNFVSAAIGTLDDPITSGATGFEVTPFANIKIPSQPFDAYIEDELITVTNVAGTTWTVTRAGGSVAHAASQIVNISESFIDTEEVQVGTLASTISATQTQFVVSLDGADVAVGTYLEIDGERMLVTVAPASFASQQTLTVKRGVCGTVPSGHGSNVIYSNTGADYTVRNYPDGSLAVGILDSTRSAVAEIQIITLGTGFTSGDSFTLTYGLNTTVAFVHSTNCTSGDIQTALRTATGNSSLTASGTTNQGPFTVTFVSGTQDYSVITITDPVGFTSTGSVAETQKGYAANGFIGRLTEGTKTVQFYSSDANQFIPSLFDDMSSVKDKFGAPLVNGAINSELSLAAQLAFANGATQLILVETDPADGVDGIQLGIDKLESEQTVNVIVALSGADADTNYLQTHVSNQSTLGNLRRGFVGLDGIQTSSNFITRAQQFFDERVSLVAPAKPLIDMGESAPLALSGYFLAAAVAGVHAGLQPQEPLTRKQVWGFVGLDDQDASSNIFQMQSKGVLVVAEDRFGRLIIKHGLTTNMMTDYTREISVVAARDRLRDLVFETLESGELIGSAITVSTPNLVAAGVTAALDTARAQGLIYDYGDVTFRQPANTPTMIEVQFTYRPTLPLNYVHVQFAIDTAIGTVEFQSINEQPAPA